MRKPLVVVLGSIVLVGGAWVGASRLIGGMVATEVAHLESSLAAVDQVQVNRLQYQREWFQGTIHYDLLVRPLPGDPLYTVLHEAFGASGTQGMRLQGQLTVQHGPWLGSGGGSVFGLARATGGLPLPEALRPALPNYPGQRPLVELTANLNLARQVAVTFTGTDYRGPVVAAHTTAPANLVFAGLRGQAEFTSSLSQFNTQAQLAELTLSITGGEPLHTSLQGLHLSSQLARANTLWHGTAEGGLNRWTFADDEVEGELGTTRFAAQLGSHQVASQPERPTLQLEGDIAAFNLQGQDGEALQLGAIRVRSDATRAWPMLWMGKADVTLAASRLAAEGHDITLGSLQLTADSQTQGGLVEQASELTLGPLAINGIPLSQKAQLRTVLSGVNGDALNTLMLTLERAGYDEQLLERPEFQTAVQASLGQILAAQPRFAISPLAFTLQQPDDIQANLSVQFQGEPGLSLDDPVTLLERITLDAQGQVTLTALRELIRLSRLADADFAAPPSATSPEGQTLTREIDEEHQALLKMAAQIPYLSVNDQSITLRGQFRDGKLTLNDQPADDMLDLLAQLNLGSDSHDADDASATTALDWRQPGLADNVTLRADFPDDPRTIRLLAGGHNWLNGELGPDCIGHVNGEQPDVVLNYTAGEWPLTLYAESAHDTILIVRSPNGQWHCNDDAQGLDPAITFTTPPTGQYAIWIGTHDPDTADATLNITEMAR